MPEEQSPYQGLKLEEVKLQFQEKIDKFKLMPVTILLIVFMMKDVNDLMLSQDLKIDELTVTVLSCYGVALVFLTAARCWKKRIFVCFACLLLTSKITVQTVLLTIDEKD